MGGCILVNYDEFKRKLENTKLTSEEFYKLVIEEEKSKKEIEYELSRVYRVYK